MIVSSIDKLLQFPYIVPEHYDHHTEDDAHLQYI